MPRLQLSPIGKLWMVLPSSILVYLALAYSQWTQSTPRNIFTETQPVKVPTQETYHALSLSERECNAIFPDLTRDLEETIALGPFTLKQAHGPGPLQARVKDGQLFIIHAEDESILSSELLQAQQAALHQINKAILTSPEPLPETIFSLNVRDQPYGTAMSYTRPAYPAPASSMPPLTRAFLMPHFSFWNWPLRSIGSISRASEAISALEARLGFTEKDPRVVWRGSAHFNSARNPSLRQDLLHATAGAAWADVRALESYEVGSGSSSQNSHRQAAEGAAEEEDGVNMNTVATREMLMIEDFCRYKYILYTDGITYSGRLSFHQLCNSVILTPPPAWRQLTTHLLRPAFSTDLVPSHQTIPSAFSQDMLDAYPTRYTAHEANIIFVAPDWSDLEATISWLEEHPDIAERIARNQRDLFLGRGYTSPAMETCYWRALLRGWCEVVRLEGEGWEDEEGVSWEEFSITQSVTQE
ncbi:glycosyl transferase family 90-domain-containing protein [Xylaria arbuscula]|nr:glycosyl transferase family 90-domain-containing protein [Xylaria arbuscula]